MWLNLILRIGLVLLGVLALLVFSPLILFSLEVVVAAAFLMLIGAVGVKLWSGLHRLHAWCDSHHWLFRRHDGPKLKVS